MSETNIAIGARRGKKLSTGAWNAYLLLEDGREVSMGYGYPTQQEALRTADTYRRRWLGEDVPLTFVSADDKGRRGSAFVQDIEDESLLRGLDQ